jgi:hypothetical protein
MLNGNTPPDNILQDISGLSSLGLTITYSFPDGPSSLRGNDNSNILNASLHHLLDYRGKALPIPDGIQKMFQGLLEHGSKPPTAAARVQEHPPGRIYRTDNMESFGGRIPFATKWFRFRV